MGDQLYAGAIWHALRNSCPARGVAYNHSGGWGIFDAPEPWGPWTTAFHTDYWGLGGTHGYRLPAKWIGPDAKDMTLIFSGVKLPDKTYDAFCVRRMTLDSRQAAVAKNGSLERIPWMIVRLLFVLLLASLSVLAQQDPQFTKDGRLVKPGNYREWIFLSSGLGMTYGPTKHAANDAPRFDNVFVEPQAYKAFLKTGTWPDRTIFALEVRSSATNGSINRGGHYQEGVVGLEVEVKDESRFPGKWAFFDFSSPGAKTAKVIPTTASCYSCHSSNGAVDNTFVQFYPTLAPVAKAKGTFKQGGE
jgi:hypothetical protein